uniref:Xyloglucan endotransglucosylase/hydrolase n=1 Tax=Aegilops tauschii subsp. strangulata TaxID=200361 RepID=A0A453D2R8_AEGTS
LASLRVGGNGVVEERRIGRRGVARRGRGGVRRGGGGGEQVRRRGAAQLGQRPRPLRGRPPQAPPRQLLRYGIRVQEQVLVRQGDRGSEARAGGLRRRRHCMMDLQLSSAGEKHNEFDFEFLGNVTGEPYLVQTNLYIDGVGNREQRIDLWFDPTADFHTYAVLWNPSQVVFLVDDTPIRVYDNKNASATKPKGHHRHPNATTTQAQTASAFPSPQPMAVYSSIWNADDWATRGGLVKTDWSHAPFVATFRDVRVEGCAWAANASDSDAGEVARCSGSSWGKEGRYWWKEKDMQELSVHQSHQLVWARAHHLVYDYCVDTDRFPVQPPECAGR